MCDILKKVRNMININTTNLYKVLKDFYTLTNIKIVLFDKEGGVMMEYPSDKRAFCNIISENESWKKKCDECDRMNFEKCRKTGKTWEYFCHLGLFEAVTPIYDENGILGYVLFGQVLVEGEEKENTVKRLKILFPEEEFCGVKDAIENITVKTTSQLDACVTVLQAITSYMLSNRWVVPRKSDFIRHMDKFIENNLEKNISVDAICTEFHIRRTRLYAISKNYLGCSIAMYIRKQRIVHAQRMLEETDDSVENIAYSVGFSDYGHFSRVFKQITGKSATEYRRKNV